MGKELKSLLLLMQQSKLILTSDFIYLQSSFLFQHGEKATKAYIILLQMLLSLQETS